MAIREDLVSSAAQFLQDPNVASSSVENKIVFLRTKNLTQEEINAALARAGGSAPPPYQGGHSGPPAQYYQPYPQHAWSPNQVPGRDWRDWFIMATVMGGVGYGLFSLGKRYVYPLVAPPTPERLEEDKKSIEEQFERAFSLVDQLSKDTEALKEAEKQRTERLDTTLSELETVMTDLKMSNRRREDDTQRIRDEVQALKDAIPKAVNNQKDITNNRLSEINTELVSLRTLVSQRMKAPAPTVPSPPSTYMPRMNGGTSPPMGPANRLMPSANDASNENSVTPTPVSEPPRSLAQSTFNRISGSSFSTSEVKASIPAWQMAMANKNTAPSPSPSPVSNAAETAKDSDTAVSSSP
ncbi:Peroxisomal membrane protein PER10 [Escovopsis weberi]|uniref:Peroxisomal membrane protein PEX14 n=1 Tax=Escovopsis weberi TaxID=150374 RepID=A0A0M9VX04_ESCWE|nr:Peroxisomal membrane protein PER10 [Escovopsis weberi]